MKGADDSLTGAAVYDGSDHVLTMKAVLPDGPDSGTALDEQITEYVYGVSTDSGSAINSNDLLFVVKYPDKSTGAASEGEEEGWLYNAQGQHTLYQDRNGTIHDYTYDPLGRLITDAVTLDFLGSYGVNIDDTIMKHAFTFDDAGRAEIFTSYDGSNAIVNQVQRAYNGLGQLTKEYQSHSGAVNTSTTPKVQYSYSEMAGGANHSRLTSMTYPNGRVVNYTYSTGVDTNISRLSVVRDGTSPVQTLYYLGLNTVVYEANGGHEIILYSQTSPPAIGIGGDKYIGLDGFGRTVNQLFGDGDGVPIIRFKYGYDAGGNRLWKEDTEHPAESELYTYDNLNRLITFKRGTLNTGHTAITGTPAVDKSWALDALGNWKSTTDNLTSTTTTRTHNFQNQLTINDGDDSYAYDGNGNLVYDGNQTYAYDAWNRMASLDGLSFFSYDALGRKIISAPSGDPTIDYYFSDQWQVVEDQVAGDTKAVYVWSPLYVDQLIFRDRDSDDNTATGDVGGSGSGMDERLFAVQDANYNVIGLLDSFGFVQQRFVYDPYGQATALNPDGTTYSGTDYPWSYLDQGGRRDASTGLTNFRNREYDASLGRWMQQDPMGYVDGGNLYEYERGNTINGRDPYGLFDWWDNRLNREALEALKRAGVAGGCMVGGGGVLIIVGGSIVIYDISEQAGIHDWTGREFGRAWGVIVCRGNPYRKPLPGPRVQPEPGDFPEGGDGSKDIGGGGAF